MTAAHTINSLMPRVGARPAGATPTTGTRSSTS
jgi:hypothetical protein